MKSALIVTVTATNFGDLDTSNTYYEVVSRIIWDCKLRSKSKDTIIEGGQLYTRGLAVSAII